MDCVVEFTIVENVEIVIVEPVEGELLSNLECCISSKSAFDPIEQNIMAMRWEKPVKNTNKLSSSKWRIGTECNTDLHGVRN